MYCSFATGNTKPWEGRLRPIGMALQLIYKRYVVFSASASPAVSVHTWYFHSISNESQSSESSEWVSQSSIWIISTCADIAQCPAIRSTWSLQGARHSAVVKNVKSNWRATLKLPQDHPFVSRSKYNTMLSTYVSAPSPINKQTSSLVLYLKSPKSYK